MYIYHTFRSCLRWKIRSICIPWSTANILCDEQNTRCISIFTYLQNKKFVTDCPFCCEKTFTWLQKYLCRQNQYSRIWDSKGLALIAEVDRAFGMNPKVGGSSPLRSRYFLFLKLRHFHKNIRSWVENKCASRTQLTFQMFTTKISVPWEILKQ